MRRYTAQRLVALIPVLLGVSIIVFGIMHLVPGDVVLLRLSQSPGATPQDIADLKKDLGLDESVPVQYQKWMTNLIQGDMGRSLWTNKPVREDLQSKLPVSLELALLAGIVAIIIGIPAGVVSAVWQGSWVDYLTRVTVILGLAVPNFALATLALVLFSIWFAWSPEVWYHPFTEDPVANIQQMLLPSLLLGFSLSASISRMTRATMLEVLRQDYIRTARAKGLRQFIVVVRHGLKNALPPVLTIIGLQFGFLMSGTVVIESIFGLPGMGRLMLDAISHRDYTLVQGAVLVVAFLYVSINLMVDLAYGVVDPRIRYR